MKEYEVLEYIKIQSKIILGRPSDHPDEYFFGWQDGSKDLLDWLKRKGVIG